MILLAVKVSIALLVFGVGLTATMRDVTYFLRHRALFVWTMVSMYVAMPLFVVWLCLKFEVHPAIRIALVALSISPVPPFLPTKSSKAGGHGSYTISLVVATSLLAAAIVPASLWIIGRLFGLPLSAPIGNVIKVVATTLLVPMGIGIAVAHFRPAAAHAGKRVMTLATIVLAVAVVPILFTSWPTFRGFVGDGTLAVIVAFTLTGLCVGYVLGGPEPEHRTVLALATASRHPAVALAIATENFPGNKLIVPALLLALLVSAAASTPFVMKSRKRARERLHSQAAMTGDDAEQERISFRGTPDQAPVAHAPDRPERIYRTKRVPVWGFALFLLGLAGIAVLTWREVPRFMGWGSETAPTIRDAAGDVKIDTRMAPAGRISNMPEYVVQYFTSVGFAPGSAALTRSGKQLLDNLMDQGDTLRAYFVEVAAFADAPSEEASNTSLSAARADSVIAYLARVRLVPMERIMNATGLDTSRAADAVQTLKGGPHAKNRRADVRIVVMRRTSPR